MTCGIVGRSIWSISLQWRNLTPQQFQNPRGAFDRTGTCLEFACMPPFTSENKSMWKTQRLWWTPSKRSKNGALCIEIAQNITTKASFGASIWNLYGAFKTSGTCEFSILHLYVQIWTVSETWSLFPGRTFLGSLRDVEPFKCGTFVWNLDVEP